MIRLGQQAHVAPPLSSVFNFVVSPFRDDEVWLFQLKGIQVGVFGMCTLQFLFFHMRICKIVTKGENWCLNDMLWDFALGGIIAMTYLVPFLHICFTISKNIWALLPHEHPSLLWVDANRQAAVSLFDEEVHNPSPKAINTYT